jgi:MOFRL family.
MGTDGIDGNSSFAGAITENIKVDLNTMKEFLRNSDSARFFQKQKGQYQNKFHTHEFNGHRHNFKIKLLLMAITVTTVSNTSMI